MQRLLSSIESPKSGYGKLEGNSFWIIDSGTSCHMIRDLHKLNRKHLLYQFPWLYLIEHAQWQLASFQASINLSLKINLHRVLYIPNCSCNLIFVAQLI